MLGCTGIPRPPSIPDDWIEYTGWDCMCPLYIPGNSKIRPPKIEWGPCDFKIPEHIKCQRTIKPGKGWMAAENRSAKDPKTGEFIFQTGFTDEIVDFLAQIKGSYGVIAKENGETISHFYQVTTDKCGMTASGLSSSNYIFRVDPMWDSSLEGAVAGNITDLLPNREMKFPSNPSLISSWRVTPSWIIRMRGDRTAYRWDDPEAPPKLVYTASMLGRTGHKVLSHNDDVFIQVGSIQSKGVAVWTEAGGTKPLILYPVATRSAFHFHTDGEHMVWSEMEGWNGDTLTFAVNEVFVAPYSLDQEQVSKSKKKLTNDLGVSGTNWHVGCGYAARGVSTENPSANSLMVVRLSDGWWWIVPGGDVTQPWRYDFDQPFGLTCEEVFVTTLLPSGAPTIARIRLDSLGPGMPPSE